MKIVKFFYDLETTGVYVTQNGIHQIAGLIEVNGKVVEEINFNVAPNPKAIIEKQAMDVCKVTEEQIKAYPEMKVVYRELMEILKKYCDRFNAKDKIWLVGFNNRTFDDIFFRAWFEQNGSSFFGAWFWQDSIDVLVLASQYLIPQRHTMPSFKLHRVAKTVGIAVDETKLHDALYDIYLTREIYNVITKVDKPSLF